MWFNLQRILFYFVILQTLGQFVKVEGKRKRGGKAKAIGGFLAGGVAGYAASKIIPSLNKPQEVHHHHHISGLGTNSPNAVIIPPKPVTTIERGETLPNGCYKQTVKEPLPNDMTRFTETVQLICPQANPAPIENKQTFVHMVPVISPAPLPVQAAPLPVQAAPLQPLQPSVSGQATITNTLPVQAVSPVQTVAAPPQVIVLNRSMGSYHDARKKRKNAATSLFGNNFAVLLCVLLVLRLF